MNWNPFRRKQNDHLEHWGDFEREMSLESRKSKAEIRRLEHQIQMTKLQAELQLLREELAESRGSDGDLDGMMDKILKFAEMGKQQPQQPQKKRLSDAEIAEIIDKTPKSYLKAAKSMKDEQIADIISKQFPDIDDNSIARIIKACR